MAPVLSVKREWAQLLAGKRQVPYDRRAMPGQSQKNRTYILVFVALAASLTGCAGSGSDTNKQLEALREELTLTQNALDQLEERLASVERAGDTRAAPAVPSNIEELSRPPLKVVKVDPASAATEDASTSQSSSAPETTQQDDSAEDAARPVIRGEGTRLEAKIEQDRPATGTEPRRKQ